MSRERQLDLFAPYRPLVEKLGAEFFRRLPESAGVYRFFDAEGRLLYVGKAKNLRARLGSYRAEAHVSRKTRRLVGQTASIEYDLCDDEEAALSQESRLIRFHRPKFNRAGVWVPAPWRLKVEESDGDLELLSGETPSDGDFGPFGTSHRYLMASFARLAWLAVRGFPAPSQMPRELLFPPRIWTSIKVEGGAAMAGPLRQFVRRESPGVIDTFRSGVESVRASFDRNYVEAELEPLTRFWERPPGSAPAAAEASAPPL